MCTQANMLAAFPLTTAREGTSGTLSLPGVTKHVKKFPCKATQTRGGGLTIHSTPMLLIVTG